MSKIQIRSDSARHRCLTQNGRNDSINPGYHNYERKPRI